MLAPGGKITITVMVQVCTETLGTNNAEFPQVSDQESPLITAP